MAIRITIPEPCSENWAQMTPTQKGAFCDKCAKEVIDFTQISRAELARKVRKGDNLCGRFRPDQLNTPLPELSRNRWREGVAALGFTSLMLTVTEVSGQTTPREPVEIHVEEVEAEPILGTINRPEPLPMPEEGAELRGIILDQDSLPLPGARVALLGTRLEAQTNFDGEFVLRFAPNLREGDLWLQVDYLGFMPQQIRIAPNATEPPQIRVSLEADMLGGIVVSRWNIFRRIGNLFRRRW